MILSPLRFPGLTLQYVVIHIGGRVQVVLPEGNRSMTGWLSTCSVALPPLRVNRTTWYLPSLTVTALSSMMMSSVPTLKMTPIFPRSCWQWRRTLGDANQVAAMSPAHCRSKSFLEGNLEELSERSVTVNIICAQNCLPWFDLYVPQKYFVLASC